jgi:arginine/lysine/ornithine decarboxylase
VITLETETPIYSALIDYAKQGNVSFHTPGHKSGELFKRIGWTVDCTPLSAPLV